MSLEKTEEPTEQRLRELRKKGDVPISRELLQGAAMLAALIAMWVTGNPEVRSALGTPAEIEQLVNQDFANYYSENPAGSFALRVWVNNSWVAAQCIAFAVLLGIPIPWVLFQNAANLGVTAGLMIDAGNADILFGLLTPPGLLELTAVFLAGAAVIATGAAVATGLPEPRRR